MLQRSNQILCGAPSAVDWRPASCYRGRVYAMSALFKQFLSSLSCRKHRCVVEYPSTRFASVRYRGVHGVRYDAVPPHYSPGLRNKSHFYREYYSIWIKPHRQYQEPILFSCSKHICCFSDVLAIEPSLPCSRVVGALIFSLEPLSFHPSVVPTLELISQPLLVLPVQKPCLSRGLSPFSFYLPGALRPNGDSVATPWRNHSHFSRSIMPCRCYMAYASIHVLRTFACRSSANEAVSRSR